MPAKSKTLSLPANIDDLDQEALAALEAVANSRRKYPRPQKDEACLVRLTDGSVVPTQDRWGRKYARVDHKKVTAGLAKIAIPHRRERAYFYKVFRIQYIYTSAAIYFTDYDAAMAALHMV